MHCVERPIAQKYGDGVGKWDKVEHPGQRVSTCGIRFMGWACQSPGWGRLLSGVGLSAGNGELVRFVRICGRG